KPNLPKTPQPRFASSQPLSSLCPVMGRDYISDMREIPWREKGRGAAFRHYPSKPFPHEDGFSFSRLIRGNGALRKEQNMKRQHSATLAFMAFLFLTLLAGCTYVSVETRRYLAVPNYPPTDPATVQILHAPPSR